MKLFQLVMLVGAIVQCRLAIAQEKPVVFSTSAAILQAGRNKIKSKGADTVPAYKQLLANADKALQWGPHSVMEKLNEPPGGNKHDYMSLAPYFGPDRYPPFNKSSRCYWYAVGEQKLDRRHLVSW